MKRDDKNGIDERSFRFFCDVIAFVETIPIGPKTSPIIEQLVDAAGSIGGNREEALGGSSHVSSFDSTRSHCGVRMNPCDGCEHARATAFCPDYPPAEKVMVQGVTGAPSKAFMPSRISTFTVRNAWKGCAIFSTMARLAAS